MRVPHQTAVRTLAALIALAVGALHGCAAPAPIRVQWDEREDLSRFRTWDWIDGDPVFVHAPFGDGAQVEAQLSALLESELRGRGLERAVGGADLRVAAMMVETRIVQTFRRGRAMQTLHTHHDVGGFEVQSEELERRRVDRCRVAIYVTGPRQERMVWQAVSERRHPDGCARHLDDAVGEMLERFPRARSSADATD